MRIIIACAGLLALAACSALPAPDAATTDADAARIEAAIVKACTADGMFRPAVRAGVTIAVPAGTVPLSVAEAGVDIVCANPARYARDAGSAIWVARNLADIVKARAAQR